MRSVLIALAIGVALTSIACGSAPEGNAPSSDSAALESLDQLTPVVEVDTKGSGCTVNGLTFGRCTLTRTATTDVFGHDLHVCDLETDTGGMYTWQCDDAHEEAASAVERYQRAWGHCPNGG